MHLRQLKAIHTLDLSGTAITDVGLVHLRGLNCLRNLDLTSTAVTDSGVGNLKHRLSPAASVSGGTGKIQEAISDAFPPEQAAVLGKIYKVTIVEERPGNLVADVDLWYSTETDTELRHLLKRLAGVKQLRTLQLPTLSARLPSLECLEDLRQLRGLVFPATYEMDDTGLSHLARLTRLERLTVHGKRITDAGIEHLKPLKALRSLNLWGTSITGAGLRHLSGMHWLESLNLDGSGITDDGLAFLTGMSQLRSLCLAGTKVTDAGLLDLRHLASLRSLDLSRTAVSDAGVAHLKGLSQLRDLNLSGTGITPSGEKDLQRALPHVLIQHSWLWRDPRTVQSISREARQCVERKLPCNIMIDNGRGKAGHRCVFSRFGHNRRDDPSS